MKKCLVILLIVVGFSLVYPEEVRLKPYILAGIEKGDDINVAVEKVEKLLTDNEFEIVGKYSPLKEDKKRVVICATHETLKKAVKKIESAMSKQLLTITMLVNWKNQIEKKRWYKKDWFKAIIVAFLTALFMTISSKF